MEPTRNTALETETIAQPERISLAGQNILNIVRTIFVAFILCIILVVFVILEPKNSTNCIIIASVIQSIAIIIILIELKNAGGNLRSSYSVRVNNKDIYMSEILQKTEYIEEIKKYHPEMNKTEVKVENNCPACNHPIDSNQCSCASCGLNFVR
jgi:hypothetical protein